MSEPVTIVMATYNGAAHLPAQLASIAAQRGVRWRLLASDDGSDDETCAILRGFAAAHPGRVRLCSGPKVGFAANFLTALARAVAEAPGHAVAFADQDDIWLPEKLARATAHCHPGMALGLACRAVPTDARLACLGVRDAPGPAAFGALLLGRAPGGNRLVLSSEAAARVAASLPAALRAGVPFHDWWSVLVLTGSGGRLVHDTAPGLLYRQHPTSTLGYRGGFAGMLKRATLVLSGRYGRMVAANLAGLDGVALTGAAQADIAALRRGQGPAQGAGWRAHLIRPVHAAPRSKPSRAISA